MSQQNVDALLRFHQATATGFDAAEFARMLTPDVVWDYSRSSFPEAGVYHGLNGVREWFRGLDEAFANLHWEVQEITDLSGGQVLVELRLHARGQSSEIAVDYTAWMLWTFLGEKASRVARYDTRAEALEAVGLRE
ncbi:MAG: hypothetical protein NVS1B9_03850 [Solirubrobacteraceae bacterium]